MIDLEKLRHEAEDMSNVGLIRTVNDLVDHIAQLEKDAGRLDWMIEQRAYVVSDETCGDGYWLNFLRPDGTTWVQVSEHKTPREAIDTAMEAKHG